MMKTLLAIGAAMALGAVLVAPAGAHTAMLRASPDRDATAGGAIGFVDLEFLDPVTEASVTVTYNGQPVPGQTTVADGKVITFTLDQPLTQPGRYQVFYEMVSFDSDFTTGGFFFTFDPAAEQVARIEPSVSEGLSTTTVALSAIGLIALIGVPALYVWRIDRRRQQLVESVDAYGPEDHYR